MLNKLLNLFRSRQLDAEIREELAFHRSQTNGHFGNATLVQDQMHEESTVVWLETLIQDVRYGLRQLRKTPGFVAVAILSLAVGIGANTAIFTLINAFLLQSLPVRDPGQLVLLYDSINTGVYSGNGFLSDTLTYPSWQHLHAHNQSFESLCAFRQGNDRVTMRLSGTAEAGVPEYAEAHLVSGNYFQVLGVEAAAGRVLRQEDETANAPPAAIISHHFWQNRFRRDPQVVGKNVVLNGTSVTVVGVAAPEFFGERVQTPPDFWLPLSLQPQILQRESWLAAREVYWLNMLGRLKPDVTLRQASAAVTVQLQQFYAGQAGTVMSDSTRRTIQSVRVDLKEGGKGISGLRYLYSQPLHLLMAVVGLVLLIACANIATLLLARASARRQEFAARLALGASRSRIVRQVLTESMLLSALGGLAGVLVAWWSVKGLLLLLRVNPVVSVRPDPIVLAFTLAISLSTGVLFGLVPALRYSRMDGKPGTTERVPSLASLRFSGVQMLIVAQVALSLVLLLGAGLLTRSLVALQSQNIGYQRENILLVRTDPRLAGYDKKELPLLYQTLDERLNRIPGVISASLAHYTPLSGNSSSHNFTLQGKAPIADMKVHSVDVGPRFFETLGMALRLGRTISPRDTAASPLVAVVNESFIVKYLSGQQPLGQRFSLGSPFQAPGFEIVGVVADAKYYDLREPVKPMAFLAAWQSSDDSVYAGDLILRTSVASSGILPEVRRVLNDVTNKLAVLSVTTLDQQLDRSLRQQKIVASLCSVFSMVALLLACIGIYGTLAYAVARRSKEIGIRMAIGARHRTVLWLFLRESFVLVAVGMAVGLPLAFAAVRGIRSLLFGIAATDPLVTGSAVGLVAAVALLACYLPARRATRIEPALALRNE